MLKDLGSSLKSVLYGSIAKLFRILVKIDK
jgi:hypothetical protein